MGGVVDLMSGLCGKRLIYILCITAQMHATTQSKKHLLHIYLAHCTLARSQLALFFVTCLHVTNLFIVTNARTMNLS